jgi:protein-S-isoprenylcysteine O-methyltransferase Ste14
LPPKPFSTLISPPLTFLTLLVLSYGANWLLPLTFPEPFQPFRFWIAGFFFFVAFIIGGWGVISMKRCKTPIEPGEEATTLVICGPYRFTRNPLYIALTSLSLFFATIAGSFWYLAGAAILFLLLNFVVIPREEKYLAERFGQQYENYKKGVRRWI